MGFPIRMRISPEAAVNLSLGMMFRLPAIEIGTIGNFYLTARENQPFLKGWSKPSGLLDPSGKMTTDIPSLIF